MTLKRIYIEITNKCNLRCSFCNFNTRKPEEMSIDLFKSIIEQVKPITKYIYLHVQGEPLLHSSFDELLSICDQNEMNVQLVTNGFYLNKIMDIHSHSSIRKVSISIHSVDEQRNNANEYIKNVIEFIEKNKNYFYIECRFWIMNKLKEKSKYCLDTLQKTYSFSLTKKNDSYKMTHNTYIMFAKEFEWPSNAHSNQIHGTCLGAKTMLAILSNGQVTICCLDENGEINLGNIKETTLIDILESEKFQNILKGFNNNKCVEPLCQRCTYKNRFN